MNRKISLGWVICAIFLTIALTFLVSWQVSQNEFNKNLTTSKLSDDVEKKVSEVEGIIKEHYIEDISESDLIDYAGSGLVYSIGDKYATYFTAEEFEKHLIENSGKFTGIGASIKNQDDGILVTDVYENSPAKEAGVKIGDLIIKLGGKEVSSLTTTEINDAVKGEDGETFDFTVKRENEKIDFSVVRSQFDRVYVISRMLDNKIGYIRITEFEETTPEQFNKAYDALIKDGAKAFVFDVRNNAGGTVTSICDVVDKLIPEGTIATAKFKDGTEKTLGTSNKEEMTLPSVILANSNTASAAELFCAALKDYNKAEIVGMNTFGKGVMQEYFRLSDGSAVKLTTAKYYTPKGENYDGVGIKPDYEVKQSENEQLLIFGKNEADDTQLQKAIEVISKKISK